MERTRSCPYMEMRVYLHDKENAGPRWLPERLVKTVNLPVSRMEQLSPPKTNLISFPDAAPGEDTHDPVAD